MVPWGATWSAAASSLFLEVSVVLASVSFCFIFLSEASRAAAGIFARRCATTGAGEGSWLSRGPTSCQSTETFRRIFFPGFLARAVRIWKFVALFPYSLVSGSHAFCVSGYYMWNSEIWIIREILRLFVRNAWNRQWIHALHQYLALLDEFCIAHFLRWSGLGS